MPNPFQTRNFKELQQKWYKRLEEEGFKEAEDVSSSREYLKTWHSHYFKAKYSAAGFLEGQEYFSLASNFLVSHAFDTDTERAIWELHSNGATIRECVHRIQSELGLPVSRWKVNDVIMRLRNIMLGAT